MERLPPIPIPLSARWREFRVRFLPGAIALLAAGLFAWLWQVESSSGNFPGVAEGVRSTVSSPQAGALRQLLVEPFQFVRAGDPVAILVPDDMRNGLAALQSELQLLRLGTEPSVPEQNAMDYERLRFDFLRMKSELATAEVDLRRAENQIQRDAPLFQQKLLSEDAFDLAAKTRDGFLAEVQTKSNAVSQMEERLRELRPLGEPQPRLPPDSFSGLLGSYITRQRELSTNLGPRTLRAPIDGMVSSIVRYAGEQVVEGEPLMIISSARADRVVGYMRQPYPVRPEVGMQAVLRTRELRRREYAGRVSQVGAQVEYITNSLALIRPGAMVDTGLPIVVDLSIETGIRPGEIVDIGLQAAASLGE